MKIKFRNLLLIPILLGISVVSKAQCSIASSAGYTVAVTIKALAIIPSSSNCTWGYNYNVRFSYSITVTGVNRAYNANIGIQPQIICNSQNNGYNTIFVPAPTFGAPTSTRTYTGTLTTTSSPWRNFSDCNSVTLASLGCNSLQVIIFGPGYNASQTYPCTFSTLPITLASFDANCDNENLNFKWSTASEINNDFFTIENSNDGVNWSSLATIKGAGTSTTTLMYNKSVKRNENTHSYFRLKQTDFDGAYAFSDVIIANECNATTNEKNVIYTVADKTIYSLFEEEQEQNFNIKIYNLFGQEIYSSPVFRQQINLSNQTNGVYFIHTNSINKNSVQKIILEN